MSGERKAVNEVNVPYVAFSEGYKHPGTLVETRNLHYATKTLPSYTIRNEKVKTYLSDAQLDAVAMACESFETMLPSGDRQGFLLGDGAGVGKNRSICGIIAEIMYCQSRERSEKLHAPKALLITCSNALFTQTENDLMELDVKEPLFMLDNRYESLEFGKNRGILYTTYAMLIASGTRSVSRLEQMVNWLGTNFEGLIVFDDCHSAKRYSVDQQDSTITVSKVVELQKSFPKARILYSSSTGLSTFTNVGYLQRLGLYGLTHITRGVSAMELLEAELRAKGLLIARTLSMEGVVFNRLECHIDAALYNESTLIWSMIYQHIKADDRNDGIIISRFWQAHKRYFAALILSCKINPVVERARLELANDKAIVIGLQSTGEARLRCSVSKNNMKEEDQFSVAREILLEVLEKIVKINIDEDEPAISDSKLEKIQCLHNESEEDAILHWVQSEWEFLPSKLNGTFLVYRPHDCVASTMYGFEQRCLKPIPQMLLEKWWKRQVRAMVKSPGQCAHHYIPGNCDKRDCSNKDVAKYEMYVLTGPLSLSLVWDDVRKALFGNSYLKAIRLSATNGARKTEKLIGLMIPTWTLPSLYENMNAVLNA